jgi:hypothetical protein
MAVDFGDSRLRKGSIYQPSFPLSFIGSLASTPVLFGGAISVAEFPPYFIIPTDHAEETPSNSNWRSFFSSETAIPMFSTYLLFASRGIVTLQFINMNRLIYGYAGAWTGSWLPGTVLCYHQAEISPKRSGIGANNSSPGIFLGPGLPSRAYLPAPLLIALACQYRFRALVYILLTGGL